MEFVELLLYQGLNGVFKIEDPLLLIKMNKKRSLVMLFL